MKPFYDYQKEIFLFLLQLMLMISLSLMTIIIIANILVNTAKIPNSQVSNFIIIII